MKWGVRRYQNADGSYNAAGRERYGVGDGKSYSPVKAGSSRGSATKITKGGVEELRNHVSTKEFKKQAAEIWKSHKVDSKQTSERKAYDKAIKNLGKYAGKEEGAEWQKAVKEADKAEKAWQDSKHKKADDAWKEISGVALKDLGYDDTDEGREYIKEYVALYAR